MVSSCSLSGILPDELEELEGVSLSGEEPSEKGSDGPAMTVLAMVLLIIQLTFVKGVTAGEKME